MNEGGPQDENRHTPRHPLITFCWFLRIDDAAQEGEEAVAQVRDVSDQGIGMLTPKPIAAGARLLVELVSKVGRVSVIGQVANVGPTSDAGVFRLGVRIVAVPPNDQATWRRILGS
jgi:hypothetical protein